MKVSKTMYPDGLPTPRRLYAALASRGFAARPACAGSNQGCFVMSSSLCGFAIVRASYTLTHRGNEIFGRAILRAKTCGNIAARIRIRSRAKSRGRSLCPPVPNASSSKAESLRLPAGVRISRFDGCDGSAIRPEMAKQPGFFDLKRPAGSKDGRPPAPL